jgi:hypothetical protein
MRAEMLEVSKVASVEEGKLYCVVEDEDEDDDEEEEKSEEEEV